MRWTIGLVAFRIASQSVVPEAARGTLAFVSVVAPLGHELRRNALAPPAARRRLSAHLPSNRTSPLGLGPGLGVGLLVTLA